MAVSSDGMRVYALVSGSEEPGLYRSDDGGNTWTLQNEDKRLTSRAWYFGNITVDPNNADVIYMPNVGFIARRMAARLFDCAWGAGWGRLSPDMD